MKKITYEYIMSLKPCYDPIKYIPQDWQGNALDILKLKDVPIDDKFWAVFREDVISDKILRLFAVCSYRETLKFIKNPDPRSIEAANIAELYALNKASREQLNMAAHFAWSAVTSAKVQDAWSAESAAWCVVWSAAESAIGAARAVGWSAFRLDDSFQLAVWSALLNKLIEMLESERE